ncbi:hypothetical protein COW64_12345 [bacterium (Candidatus Blackallbacteria) CG18_big_fil_WC_8_21_14_2_50_49_26]|nr:MAG: hypothetical protein COW64_12345 [bacterium (Candidatus Blackallbacteria) CG18_big_fil_WC_8_21_14_2_50_49_26]
MANETKIVITAATAQAEAAMGKLGNSVGAVSRKMFDLSGVVSTLGGALTVTAFAGIIKQSIDAADRLDELSQITGTSVEALAGLDYAAKQNGASLETVARGGAKLSAMLSDKPALFKKLGISATDSTEAMIQLADVFASMPDGIEKSALATKLFGDKLGGEMVLFLNQGTNAMRENITVGREYNQVTTEQAALAAQFNDNAAKLSAAAAGAGMAMTTELLPQLTQISDAMAQAAREAGILEAVWVGLGGLGTAIFTDDMLERSAQIEKRLKSINTEIQSSEGARGIATPISIPLRLERGQLEQELEDIRKQAEEAAKKPIAKETAEKTGAAEKGKKLLDALGGGASKADTNAAAVTAIQNEEFRKQLELLGVTAEQAKVYELAIKGASEAQITQAQAAADSVGAINAQIQAEKDYAKASAEAQKIIFDIDPIARASAEWEKLVALKEQGLLTDEQIGQAYAKTFKDVEKEGTSTFDTLEAAVRGWGSSFTNTLADMVLTGKGSFGDLADSIISDLLRIQIQKNITDQLIGGGTNFLNNLFSPTPNANGGVYAGAGISAYSGSVVSSPTVFPFARGIGLMGEAGPEAILPLTRINGKLGVQAQSGSNAAPNVVIQMNNQSGTNLNAKQQGQPKFDGRNWVLGIVLDAADSDPQFRSAMGIGV